MNEMAVAKIRMGAARIGGADVNLRRAKHPKQRRAAVDPKARPDVRPHSRTKCARGVDAEATDRREAEDVCGDQQAHQPGGVRGQALAVRRNEHDGHQHRGHEGLGGEGGGRAAQSRYGDRVLDLRKRDARTKQQRGKRNPGGSSDEVREHVEHCVPRADLAKAVEGERDGRVEVCAGAPAPGRLDDRNGGKAHRETHQRPA